MNLLQIVQALHREGGFPGTAPTAVTGQTGRANDLVQWCIEAYNDIQRQKDGKWRWLRAAWTLNTTADDNDYAYTEVNDTLAAVAISRFRAWDLTPRDPPHIYLTSEGESTEGEMVVVRDFSEFRYQYLRAAASQTTGYPLHISADELDTLYFGVTPDADYTVNGHYWKSNQALAADADEPEMPADYHMLIAFTALEKYAYNVVAREKLARAAREGTRLWDDLSLNQGYDRFSFAVGEALA